VNRVEILKYSATRQYRHNSDNSSDLFRPKEGFVIAYDKDVMDNGLAELASRITEMEARIDAAASLLPMWKGSAQNADGCADDLECVLFGEVTK